LAEQGLFRRVLTTNAAFGRSRPLLRRLPDFLLSCARRSHPAEHFRSEAAAAGRVIVLTATVSPCIMMPGLRQSEISEVI
jgi:hypothetical protein